MFPNSPVVKTCLQKWSKGHSSDAPSNTFYSSRSKYLSATNSRSEWGSVTAVWLFGSTSAIDICVVSEERQLTALCTSTHAAWRRCSASGGHTFVTTPQSHSQISAYSLTQLSSWHSCLSNHWRVPRTACLTFTEQTQTVALLIIRPNEASAGMRWRPF